MMLYPQSYSGFLQWSKQLSAALGAQSNGSVRIGANKLAATMAKTLPNVPDNFNINTLKALLDDTPERQEKVQEALPCSAFEQMTQDLLGKFMRVFRVELSQQWSLISEEDSLYEHIVDDCDLDLYWSEFDDVDDQKLAIILQGWLSLPHDEQRAHTNDLFDPHSPQFFGKSFEYVQSYVMGRAYRRYLLSRLEEVLDDLQHAAASAGIPREAVAAYQYFTDYADGNVPL